MPPPSAIALDATLWDEPTTGIGQYARCLAPALQARGVEVTLMGARTSGAVPRGMDVGASEFVVGRLPGLLAHRPEPLFHALANFNLPLLRVPGKRFVLTVHDLIPVLLPETVSLAYRTQFRLWLGRSLHVADSVISVSRRTAEDLRRFAPGLRTPVAIVPHGVDHVLGHEDVAENESVESWHRGLGLPPDHVLYAGALDARKNIALLLDAAEQLARTRRKVTWILVGQRWFGSDAIERRVEALRASGVDLRLFGHVLATRLYRLMRGAALFVFPSRYEGFGLPPLEAMRLGTPVIISTEGALPEVCGPAAVHLPPSDPGAWAEAVARLLEGRDERRARAEQGVRWARGFTWDRTAELTLAVYGEALADHSAEVG